MIRWSLKEGWLWNMTFVIFHPFRESGKADARQVPSRL